MKCLSLRRTGVIILILSLLAILQSQADTYFVWTNSPSDGPGTTWDTAYHTIQGAVDAAIDGDTVLVTNGVYDQGSNTIDGFNNRVAITREISVVGVCGAENTFIVGEPNPDETHAGMRCVYMTANALLSGFTLTNGSVYADLILGNGGGVLIESNGVVSNCNIAGNAGYKGGGVECLNGGIIVDCRIASNRAQSGGGGIYFERSGLARNCVISNNIAHQGGGVAFSQGGEMRDSIIIHNTAIFYVFAGGGLGGGAFLYAGGLLTNCVIKQNTANGTNWYDSVSGGGVSVVGTGLLTSCDIQGNVIARLGDGIPSDDGGAGVSVYDGGMIDNCRIHGNIATNKGGCAGGVYVHGGILKDSFVYNNRANWAAGGYCKRSTYSGMAGFVNNCVFAENYAVNGNCGGLSVEAGGFVFDSLFEANQAWRGGGIGIWRGGFVDNCTIVGNIASNKGGGVYLWDSGDALRNTIIYSNVAPTDSNYSVESLYTFGCTSSFSYCCTTPDPAYLGGMGNITNAPLFIDASEGNYRLRYDSPCRDSGTNMAAMFEANDLDGKPRVVNQTVDMGAYEFHAFSVFNDYDRNGKSDLTLYDTNSGNWYIKGVSGEVLAWEQQWGGKGLQPITGDYDGDSRSDLSVLSGLQRLWYVLSMTGSNLMWGQQWGWDKSLSVRGDYDGDGKSDLGIFGDGRWYVLSRTNTVIQWAKQWGWSGTIPVSGDYDGDGKADYAIFDGKQGNWYVLSASNTVLTWAFQWGWEGAIPVSGDFDGDGKSDLAVYDDVQGNWFIVTLDLKVLAWYTQWGYEKTIPVSGDYDGDGKSDLGIYDPSLGKWYVRAVNGKVITWSNNWGTKGLVPVR